MKITNVTAREILDSRGFPTVSCTVTLDDGHLLIASVPSGASCSQWEALEIRDGDLDRYLGKGVLHAVDNINKKIAPLLVGKEPCFFDMDKEMIALDGTKNKSNLGANALLAVSKAIARAEAHAKNKQLYELIFECAHVDKMAIPRIMSNIINGGAHANNGLAFQEFMVMPITEGRLDEHLQMVFFIYNNLKRLLEEKGYGCGIGDEGGFAPALTGDFPEKEALDLLLKAIEVSGYTHDEVVICLDVAASQFFDEKKGLYVLHGKEYSSDEITGLLCDLVDQYPIYSIEDGLAEEDWLGWFGLTERLRGKVQIVGDDLFSTNVERIAKGIEKEVADAVIIKPTQIGTISETLAAMKACRKVGYQTVVSHRSGETCDPFIADLVVGAHGHQFKAGPCVRGERTAKYNRLLAISSALNG